MQKIYQKDPWKSNTFCIIRNVNVLNHCIDRYCAWQKFQMESKYSHTSKIAGKFYRSYLIDNEKSDLYGQWWKVIFMKNYLCEQWSTWTCSDCEFECCLNCLYISIVSFCILLLDDNRTSIFVSQLSRERKTVCLVRKISLGSPYGLVQFTHFKLNFL